MRLHDAASVPFTVNALSRRLKTAQNALLTSSARLIKFHVPLSRFKMKTHLPKVNLDQRKWHIIDADGAVLAGWPCNVADILRGKNKARYYAPPPTRRFFGHSTPKRSLSPARKETAKEYMSYSGWKGGEKYRTVAQMRAKKTGKLICTRSRGIDSQEPARQPVADQAEGFSKARKIRTPPKARTDSKAAA